MDEKTIRALLFFFLFSEMNFCPCGVQNIIGIIKALMKICGSKPRVIAPSYCFMSIPHTVD